MKLTLRIWRQPDRHHPGSYERHALENVSPDLSLLEALDQLNEQLISAGQRPIGFEHDCREGICGSCGFLVNGQAHGPRGATSVCQLYLREFRDGAELTLEPWRAKAFPLIQDLMVDRSAFDRLIAAGFAAELIGDVRSPAGLHIDAVTPEEIALSIMAEIVRTRRSTSRAEAAHG